MKFDKFNKIGGTEFRVKNQINAYISFSIWFTENGETKTDADFKQWVLDTGIYSYKNDKKIKNRLSMILKSAEKRFKVIKKDLNGKYKLNFSIKNAKDDILNLIVKTDGLTKKADLETALAFKSMLDFMIIHPKLNDAKKIFHAFACFEKNDNFLDLYNTDNLFDIIAEQLVPIGSGEKALIKNCYVKKPQSLRPICKKILISKKDFSLLPAEFEAAKKSFLFSFNDRNSFEKFVRENSYDQIARIIIKNSKISNLNGDYFDLFNRVLWGLGLSPTTSKNTKNYSNSKVNIYKGKYSVLQHAIPLSLPYTLDQVNDILRKIQKQDYRFMENDPHLQSLPRADVAEYFVNMKFAYIYQLPLKAIDNFVNTNLDPELYPVSHATGSMSDMNYIDSNNNLLGIETTIHSTVNQIRKHEFNPCCSHLLNYKPPKKNNILILVQPLGSDPDVLDYFKRHGELEFKIHDKNLKVLTYSFEDVANLS